MLPGTELVAGYLFAWLVRRAKDVAGRAETEVDHALDQVQESLHDAVARKLGPAPALEAIRAEAAGGRPAPSELVGQALTGSLALAAAQDRDFEQQLGRALARIAELESGRGAPPPRAGSTFNLDGAVFHGPTQMGDHNHQHNTVHQVARPETKP
ncbi:MULTISPECIES: hypothetical protein [unclassified Kitasatospora]|uniref:hypothetical protein n=1 Tax=unclassified Kitasatospora TaxID=2633591 RepID=UPI00380CDF00